MSKKGLFFGIIVLLLFLIGVILDHHKMFPLKDNNYKLLQDYSSFKVKVLKSASDHGFVLLNDTIMVWGGHHLVYSSDKIKQVEIKRRMDSLYGESEESPTFYFLTPPYKLLWDERDSMFFKVLQDSDTLVFAISTY